jgi:hypothetical protein
MQQICDGKCFAIVAAARVGRIKIGGRFAETPLATNGV